MPSEIRLGEANQASSRYLSITCSLPSHFYAHNFGLQEKPSAGMVFDFMVGKIIDLDVASGPLFAAKATEAA